MGETHVSPTTRSGNHHHGESETAIFVRSGNPVFVFHDGVKEVRIVTAPGDYVFVPPYVPHREENPDPENPAVIVIARSTQDAIVVNLPQLYSLSEPGTSSEPVVGGRGGRQSKWASAATTNTSGRTRVSLCVTHSGGWCC